MMRGSLQGADRLVHALVQAGAYQGKGAAARAAEQLRDEAAALAPGRLGAALRVEDAADGAWVAAPPYARFVEFGTRRMAARPFLRPAVERVRAMLRMKGGRT